MPSTTLPLPDAEARIASRKRRRLDGPRKCRFSWWWLKGAYTPPSRRRGGRDLKKMLRSILCGADGVVVSSNHLLIPNGLG